MKIYKIDFKIIKSTSSNTCETISSIEIYTKDEETLFKKITELQDAATSLGFKRSEVSIIKSVLEVL